MITIAAFREPAHAHIARGFLDSAGIPAEVADEYVVGIHWLYSNAVGGVKLNVPEEHAERASSLLAGQSEDSIDETVEYRSIPGGGDLCPCCGTENIAPSKLAGRVKGLLLLGVLPTIPAVPFLLWSSTWRCRECDHRWKPDEAGDVQQRKRNT